MDAIRNGNFTSSEIVKLTTKDKSGKGFGKPALTYIEECNMERRLQRAIDKEENARALSWGKLVEPRVHDLLPTSYKFCSSETIMHPRIKFWAGSPDGRKFDDGETVSDIKCPITLKSFCQLVHPLYEGLDGMNAMNLIRDEHKDGDKYYFQLVSNSVLTNSKYAELIVYCPYKSELDAIRKLAQESGEQKYMWFSFAFDDELPYLNDGGYYKNLNIIRFEVPQEDKDLLTKTVLKAGKELIETPQLQPA